MRNRNGMGTVYADKPRVWAAAVSLGFMEGQRVRRRFFAPSKRGAHKKLRELHALTDNCASPEAMRVSVEEFVARILREKKKSLRPNSYDSVKHKFKPVVALLGRYRLADLTPPLLEGRYATLSHQGRSRCYVAEVHKTTRSLLKRAVKKGYLRMNPTDDIETFRRLPRFEFTPLTQSEAVRLLMTARETDPYYALYALALGAGLRYSELMGLRFEDYDPKAQTITVRRQRQWIRGRGVEAAEVKTRSAARTLRLPRFAVMALEEHRRRMVEEGYGDAGYVFVGRRFGGPIGNANFHRYYFKPLLKRAGLPDIRFHDLRHTSCTLSFSGSPINPMVIARRLGHTDAAKMTLRVYTHVGTVDQIDLVRRWNRYLRRLGVSAATNLHAEHP